ncbi:LysR family transcriptional regulator [Mesorhizobium sp. CAU 1741]|uniref:LysR family transcriptional regulator n=1 Tax=Mesorhizobium sp. CAU 1741 TaxID=3140366 RepID=UPI00325ACDBC
MRRRPTTFLLNRARSELDEPANGSPDAIPVAQGIGIIANQRYIHSMLNVTFRRFHVFLSVVETGTFAAAANKLEIAQPSVSAHIAALERQVGGRIFERRRGRRPVLTELGESVLVHARELMAEATEMNANVISIRSREGHRVVFACQRTLANFVLKTHITRFTLDHPEFHLVLRIGTQEEVLNDLRNGIADIGCFLSNDAPRGLGSEAVGKERLLLVASPDHPLTKRRNVKAADIEKYGFVGAASASLFGRSVAKLMASAGIRKVTFVAQVTEHQFLRELVVAGVGISCSTENSVLKDIQDGTLKQIQFDGPELALDIRQASPIHSRENPAISALLEFLRRDRTEVVPASSK